MKFHGHTRRPSIGITPDVTTATAEVPLLKYEVKVAYAEAVLRAGGLPFIMPAGFVILVWPSRPQIPDDQNTITSICQ